MNSNFRQQIIESLSSTLNVIWKNIFGKLAFFGTIIAILQAFHVWEAIFNWIIATFSSIFSFLGSLHYGVPVYYWTIILVVLIGLIWFVTSQYLYLQLVSGVFYDDFREGLGKWNYDGEGWTIEKEGNTSVLSVMNSPDGGITQVGLWDNFSFSFCNKLLGPGKIGWMVKAWDRSNYIMLQLVIMERDGKDVGMDLKQGVYIRPHFRYQGKWVIWPHELLDLSAKLSETIKKYNWFMVDIQVRGNTIDVYIEKEHIYHMFVDDPLRVEAVEQLEYQNESGTKVGSFKMNRLNVFSYSGGKVGFRCAPPTEHAHIKKVKVKPLWK